MEGMLGFVLVGAFLFFFIVVRPILRFFRSRSPSALADVAAASAKSEALFRAAFPDLQPYFHPARVADYVVARMDKGLKPAKGIVEYPPGFPDAVRSRLTSVPKGERNVLEDSAGAKLAEFTFEAKEGALGALRVGPGKFTVRRKPGQAVTVKYWHPDREFEWSPPANWKFTTRLADEAIDSRDSGTSWSSGSSFSSGGGGAAFAGGGGTFDGGGASGGWDAPGSGSVDSTPQGDSGGTSGESATSTSY